MAKSIIEQLKEHEQRANTNFRAVNAIGNEEQILAAKKSAMLACELRHFFNDVVQLKPDFNPKTDSIPYNAWELETFLATILGVIQLEK